MKKTVQFKAFDNNNDYLCFDIKGLRDVEILTGHTVIELWDYSNMGKFGISLIIQCLLIGLRESREGLTEAIVMQEMSNALENGKSLPQFILPIIEALMATGIFGGKKQAPQAQTKEE